MPLTATPRFGPAIPSILARLRTGCVRDVRCSEQAWADDEFGHARLRDVRRTRRLVRIAALAAQKPAALITSMCANLPRDVDATYDFFENPAVDADAIALAHHQATARRCASEPFVFLAVDGSSFAFPDAEGAGRIGSDRAGAKGLKTMLGLAVSPAGVPLGLLGQRTWTRGPRAKKPHEQRKVNDKETKYWHEVIDGAQAVSDEVAPGVKLWVQVDREGDSWSVVLAAVEHAPDRWTTVRAKADRNLVFDPEGDDAEPGGKLVAALDAQPVEATYELDVPAGPRRAARRAHMTLRWADVTLRLRDKRTGRRHAAPIYAVLAEEAGTTPEGEAPLRWLLLTTYEVTSVEAACLVVFGYGQRWKVETLHAALKDRGFRLEDSQLGDIAHVRRWMPVMLAVGVRLVRIQYLGRLQPEAPATLEMTRLEIQALLVMFGLEPDQVDEVTMGDVLVMLGKAGGHVGNPAKRPIGFKVLARGLQELRPLVRLLASGRKVT